MKTKGKWIQIICVIFIFIVTTSTLALSEETEVIWEIGERDCSGNEFNGNMSGHVHYYSGTNLSNFPHDINDGYKNRTHIHIYYNLTDKQSKKDMKLSLCVGDHDLTNSFFEFRVGINNITIGNYSFIYDEIPDSCNNIAINKTCKSGENVMLIENTNSPFTDHWLIWDYLNLTVKEEYCDVDPDCCSDQYCENKRCENKKEDGFPCLRQSECKSNHCVHGVCRPTDPYCDDHYCDPGENCEQDSCCNGTTVDLKTNKSNCGKCNNQCTASCCDSKCADPRHEKSCHNGDVYWIDSCGNWGELHDDCSLLIEECSDGECKQEWVIIAVVIGGVITVIGGISYIIVKHRLDRDSSPKETTQGKNRSEADTEPQASGKGIKYGDFAITSQTYAENSDWDKIVEDVFGSDYRVADWKDFKDYYSNSKEGDLNRLLDGLAVQEGSNPDGFVYYSGDIPYLPSKCFIARHNHNKPPGFVAPDNIDNHLLSLGTWRVNRKRILAVKK